MTAETKPLISKSRLIFATTAVWLVMCAVVELPRISASATTAATGDLYAHNWPFQLMVFAVFRFPLWLVALLLFLIVEFVLLTRRTTGNEESRSDA
ncbi:MAG: hypothetical protein QOI07_1031 [Verrucomicrobiota bacterium]|jgi:hypothetical protein